MKAYKRLGADYEGFSVVIRQLKEINQKIMAHKDKILQDLDTIPIGICITNQEGIFVNLNEAYARLYGYTKEELVNKPLKMVLHPDDEFNLELYQDYIEKDIEERSVISEEKRKDGSTFPLIYFSSNLYRVNQKAHRIYLAVDLSRVTPSNDPVYETALILNKEIKQLNKKLESREIAENILLHDVKRPLRNIKGICQILLSGKISEEEKQKWTQNILEITEKGLQQVETMQGISKMERGAYQSDAQQVDLIEQLEEIKETLKSQYESKHITLDFHFGQGAGESLHCCLMQAEAPYLQLLLNNLIVNAIEASPSHETVRIEVEQISVQKLCLRIHNKGTVPQSIRNNFFDKYVSTGKERGTGLGTYIAKLIVDSLQGEIKMDTSEEKGTTLTVLLPYQACYTKAA